MDRVVDILGVQMIKMLPTNGCTGNNHAVSEQVDFGKRADYMR